jgi:hypothetical protein
MAGISGSATYGWNKGMTLATDLADPLDRSEVTLSGQRPHEFRANGTFELPMGPNKLFFGNSSGWFARALERWQTSWILNLGAGTWSNITANNRMYGTGVPDVVYPIDFNKAKRYEWGTERAGNGDLNADYFGSKFVSLRDPQCDVVTNKQSLRLAVNAANERCTMNALGLIVPAGTPGSFLSEAGDNVLMVLKNPMPGTKGTLGTGKVKGHGTISFNASASKTFRVSESKSLQLRIDTENVLNHPSPGAPNLNINADDAFGNITSKSGTRTFQGQLRLSF